MVSLRQLPIYIRTDLSILLSWLCLPGLACAVAPPDSLMRPHANQSISVHLGTTGPRVFYNRVLSQSHRLTLGVGGQYIAYRKLVRIKATSDGYINILPDFAIGIAQASLKWYPFRRGTFFLVGGLGYTWHPKLSVVVTTETQLDLDGLVLTPDDVGIVNLGLRWHPVVGYLGWGFGRSIPKKRVGVGFEMGVFYLGKPGVELNYEGFLETTTIDQQVPIVERNLSNYRYLPALNLTLSYRLNKV